MEFIEWQLWWAMEPRGDERADYHAARISLTIARAFGDDKSTFEDFLLKFESPEPQTEDQMKAKLMRMTAQMGGKIKAKRSE